MASWVLRCWRALAPVPRYFGERFPWHTNLVPIGATFSCMYLLYGHPSGTHVVTSRTLAGLVAFVLLFLHLRLVDDIVDLKKDSALCELSPTAIGGRRRALLTGLAVTTVCLIILNWGQTAALIVALSALVGVTFTSFVLQPWLTGAVPSDVPSTGRLLYDAMLAPFAEGVHLVIMLYVYAVWTSVTGQSAAPLQVVGVSGTFWLAYEFWKYSRYVSRPGWRPYGLSWAAARLVLVGVLTLSLGCQIGVWKTSNLPKAYLPYAVGVSTICAFWTLRTSPVASKKSPSVLRRAPGLLFIGALELGLFLAIGLAPVLP